ncbi:MauE/DoxX family redox-associated membrane protein [uncultured Maribacter sp.]|uniref:MauE/DoxX family redox-associated membrane protein n=1 Tax=uncultured Maribacter sp. TaxID=431308 RepID=UPI0030EE8C0F|tara:strand:+ start:34264 stop:34638 length:375 start_codon:yes stop_codon:yes gene_type:complete
MKIFQIVVIFILAFLMLAGAFNHLYTPETYKEFIPDFFPETLAHILSAIAEASVGIALLIPKYRKWGGLGFFLLMIAFLPIHIWDLTKDLPAIGSKLSAYIRIAIQFLFIAAGWWIYKTYRLKP